MADPIAFERMPEGLPKTTRASGGNGRVSPYADLIAACQSEPMTWFRSSTESRNSAYSRALTLRKHGLNAKARGVDVWVRVAPDEDNEEVNAA